MLIYENPTYWANPENRRLHGQLMRQINLHRTAEKKAGRWRAPSSDETKSKNSVVCQICQSACRGFKGLAGHLAERHQMLASLYYDQFLRKSCSEDVCLKCGKKTKFISVRKGYSRYCSRECWFTSSECSILSSARMTGRPGPWKGKHHSLASRAHLSEIKRNQILAGEISFKTGKFYSQKNNKIFNYRSSFELNAYQILETLSEVKSYDVECVSIPYEFAGSTRFYIPDIRVEYVSGKVEIIEIKAECFVNHPMNQAKFKAAREWCKNRNFLFMLWTEQSEPRLLSNVAAS